MALWATSGQHLSQRPGSALQRRRHEMMLPGRRRSRHQAWMRLAGSQVHGELARAARCFVAGSRTHFMCRPRLQVPGLESFSGPVRETSSEAITKGAAASRYAAPQPRAAPHQPVVSGGRVHDRPAHARAYRACTGLIFVRSRYRR